MPKKEKKYSLSFQRICRASLCCALQTAEFFVKNRPLSEILSRNQRFHNIVYLPGSLLIEIGD